jgi:hypothetical protein
MAGRKSSSSSEESKFPEIGFRKIGDGIEKGLNEKREIGDNSKASDNGVATAEQVDQGIKDY